MSAKLWKYYWLQDEKSMCYFYNTILIFLILCYVSSALTQDIRSCAGEDWDVTHVSVLQVPNKPTEMFVQCGSRELSETLRQTGSCNISVNSAIDTISLIGCTANEMNYVDALKDIMHLNISAVKGLSLVSNYQTSIIIGKEAVIGLPIASLRISFIDFSARPKLEEIFDNVDIGLSEIEIVGTWDVPPLPESMHIKKAVFRKGESRDHFGECSQLQELEVSDWHNVWSDNWLTNCTNLKTLKLKKMTQKMLKHILSTAYSVEYLTINRCELGNVYEDIVNILFNVTKIKYLDLSNNFIKYIPEATFRRMSNLAELDLSNNELVSAEDLKNGLWHLSNLHTLSLSYNPLKLDRYCSTLFKKDLQDPLFPSSLEILYLKHISEQQDLDHCIPNILTESMKYIEVASNTIETIQISSLLSFLNHPKPLTINMKRNPIKNADLLLKKYEITHPKLPGLWRLPLGSDRKGPWIPSDQSMDIFWQDSQTPKQNVTLYIDPVFLDCRCEHVWASKLLREMKTIHFICGKTPCIQCYHGEDLVNIPKGSLDCDTVDCAEKCTCQRWWVNGTVTAYCVDIDKIPRIQNLTALHAKKSHIQSVLPEDLPDTLQYLDISNNSISHMSPDAAAALFSNPNRTVKLSGNPFLCDCDNQFFLGAIKGHSSKVTDYQNVTCGDNFLSNVDTDVICYEENVNFIILGACSMIFLIALCTTILYYRHRQEIKVWLYARGVCPHLLAEWDDEDLECQFDVFVSFAHEDERLVISELVPALDREYAVCVHYRDWVAGEWIPMQIARSVQQSRRTLVVVSEHFLSSMWGLLEFRTAASAGADGRSRVILLLLDEKLAKGPGLDPQLRAHMFGHTYLRWGEPAFWDRLRYALPRHRAHKRTRTPAATKLRNTTPTVPVIQPFQIA